MNDALEFDRTVGRVAGAIYTDAISVLPQPALMLIPPVTFKVRKVLENVTDLRLLSDHQKAELAKEIQVSIIPMLFSYELDAAAVDKMAPVIESAAFKALIAEDAA